MTCSTTIIYIAWLKRSCWHCCVRDIKSFISFHLLVCLIDQLAFNLITMAYSPFGLTPTTSAIPTPRNLSPSPAPSSTSRWSNRHGSAEQEPRDVFGRAAIFRDVPRTPRSRRARSPGEEEERRQSRERERERATPGARDQPVGLAFRIAAIEQSLGQHFKELESQKKSIDEVRQWKASMEERLDVTFKQWNDRVSGLDKNHSMAREGLREEIGSIMQSMSSRMDKVDTEFKQLMTHVEQNFKAGNFGQNFSQPPSMPPQYRAQAPQPPPGMPTRESNDGFTVPAMPESWSPLSGNLCHRVRTRRQIHGEATME